MRSTSTHLVLLCALVALLEACSDGSSGGSSLASGGGSLGGNANGGLLGATGGSLVANAGGTGSQIGGSSSQSSSGGALASGGATSNVGGVGPVGGETSGGASAVGGKSSTGGALAGGTTSRGGGSAMGGSSLSGGATSAGGKSSIGGASSVGGTQAAGGSSAVGGGSGSATVLNQSGNPLTGIVNTYTSWLSTASGDAAKLTADKSLADNMITWQMPHGGWFKYGKTKYASAWNGTEPRADWTGANGVELGTIDNNGTVTEIMFLSDVYRRSGEVKYRDSARKGLDFILTMQYSTGGFPQVYPARPNSYSNYVTFNDDAMVRVLGMLDRAAQQKAPFSADTFSATQLAKIPSVIGKAIEYILKAQIVQGSVKTVWCAQHEPNTYAPMGARSYELPSKSGSESVGVVAFLLSQPQTADVKASAQAAIAWYKSDTVKVVDTAYVSRPSGSTDDTYNPIQAKAGSTMWYRFYDLDKDTGFFSGRLPTDNPPGVGKKYDIMQIEAERRYGYQWGGAYGTRLFTYTDTIGY